MILCLVISLSGIAGSVFAQNRAQIKVSSLNDDAFPVVRFVLEVSDADGKLVSDLGPDQIEIMEDGYLRPVLQLNRIQPGTQLILSVNESPSLTNQYQGVSYYRVLMQTLEGWAQSLPQGEPGNYSYVTNNGVQLAQMEDPAIFAQALTAYQPDLLAAQPGLTSLTMALDLTTNPLSNPYMKRAILFVTPLLDAASRAALPNIAERAAQLGTRVFVWLIAPGYQLESPEIVPLRELVDLTGGEIFLFSGEEDFPNPEHYFEPLRYIYQAAYKSGITTSGEHRLVASIIRPDLQLTSEEMLFSLQVSPPNPIFLEPPVQIQRSFIGEEDPSLEPDTYPIQILLEFPDGHPRDIRYTRLYVNDELTLENITAPFDEFILPLAAYDQSTELRLKVEVEDELGLNQTSIEMPVELLVEEPQQPWFTALLSGRGLTILISLLVAALVLAVVILYNSQKNVLSLVTKRIRRSKDPVRQQVLIDDGKRKNTSSLNSPTIRKPQDSINAPAKLVRLSEDGNPIPQRVIPMIRRETTMGSDPQQAICVLDSPAVSPIHARIFQDDSGKFFIEDAGSIAGTWVNYNPVDQNGTGLEHSDIIHIGLIAFRFEFNQPTCVRKLTVTPYQTD